MLLLLFLCLLLSNHMMEKDQHNNSMDNKLGFVFYFQNHIQNFPDDITNIINQTNPAKNHSKINFITPLNADCIQKPFNSKIFSIWIEEQTNEKNEYKYIYNYFSKKEPYIIWISYYFSNNKNPKSLLFKFPQDNTINDTLNNKKMRLKDFKEQTDTTIERIIMDPKIVNAFYFLLINMEKGYIA